LDDYDDDDYDDGDGDNDDYVNAEVEFVTLCAPSALKLVVYTNDQEIKRDLLQKLCTFAEGKFLWHPTPLLQASRMSVLYVILKNYYMRSTCSRLLIKYLPF